MTNSGRLHGTTLLHTAIKGVRSNSPTFRTVNFRQGLNIVLAERTKESTKKDSRNGLGKSTLIEIIHFCLGAGTQKGKGLIVPSLNGWSFSLDMRVLDQPISVTRFVDDPTKFYIDADTTGWPIQPTPDKSRQYYYNAKEWTALLGALMFGLPAKGYDKKYQPSFRSLISYFIRRGRDAFSTPFEHYRKQHEWDKQVNNAFLLGLAWEDASDWQLLREKKTLLDDLKRAAQAGIMGDVMQDSLGELQATKVRLESIVRHGETNLAGFRVHPQYRQIEERANQLTAMIHKAANSNISDRQMLDYYQASMDEMPESTADEVITLYEEAGVALPGSTRRQLTEVQEFHHRILENRKRFLSAEIERLKRAIGDRESTVREWSEERAGILGVLKTHRALDEYTQLQQLHLKTVNELHNIDNRIDNLRRFEEGKSSLRIEEELLKKRARNDLDDRQAQRDRAIAIFNGNSEALYEAPGNLVIDLKSTGFNFDVEIKRSGSQGIECMKVFCYDLMLAELWSQREPSPGFLIHDSTIFDGVDERQRALALELAAKKSVEHGFQYICTLNSDMIPWKEFTPGFDLNSYVQLTLTDATESGSLLGIRF